MKVQFIGRDGKEHRGSIPEEKVSFPFIKFFGGDYYTVYRQQDDKLFLILYQPVSAVRPDLVLFTRFKEEAS